MKIEVSIGEAIDKLSILELKRQKIIDENKINEIQKEISVLSDIVQYKIEYSFFYKLLMYVNEKIWDMTDNIKGLSIENNTELFATISNQIFEFNQKRFRIKNWFNLITNSNIKEQKSYSSSICKIIIGSEEIFYNKISEINYLTLEYDIIIIESTFNDIIKKVIKTPSINYDIINNDIDIVNIISLETFSIYDEFKTFL
jgi:hypothetical protein